MKSIISAAEIRINALRDPQIINAMYDALEYVLDCVESGSTPGMGIVNSAIRQAQGRDSASAGGVTA